MAKLAQIITILERIAPSSLALDFDNSGLNVGDANAEISGITVCLDCTKSVMRESLEKGNNLIVSHHPLIFTPINNLVLGKSTCDEVCFAVKNALNVYSMHTNLDIVDGGINECMAKLYSTQKVCSLCSDGVGKVVEIEPVSIEELAKKTEKLFGARVRIVKAGDELVNTIAVINGAGGNEECLEKAKELGAQCLITCEVKHHVALYAKKIGVSIIESSHYATEKFFIPTLVRKMQCELEKSGIKINVNQSQIETNPFLD